MSTTSSELQHDAIPRPIAKTAVPWRKLSRRSRLDHVVLDARNNWRCADAHEEF